jgi:hypothetical protein
VIIAAAWNSHSPFRAVLDPGRSYSVPVICQSNRYFFLDGKKGKIEIDGINEIDFDFTTPAMQPVETK